MAGTAQMDATLMDIILSSPTVQKHVRCQTKQKVLKLEPYNAADIARD